MYNLKDKVKVTEIAKKDTYENAWWTEKDLIIDNIDKNSDLAEEGQYLYSFITVDGEEVPCSLYDYELELIETSVPEDIQERLNNEYSLVEYDVLANINEDEEIGYLENVCDSFSRDCSSLDTLIGENMDSFFADSMSDKLGYAEYIEDYIDEYISSCGAKSLEQVLDGGIKEYLKAQFFSNAEAIYTNLIFIELNDILEDIKGKYTESMLGDLKTLFLNFDSSDIEEMVNKFVNTEIDTRNIYDGDFNKLYKQFCEFLSEQMED